MIVSMKKEKQDRIIHVLYGFMLIFLRHFEGLHLPYTMIFLALVVFYHNIFLQMAFLSKILRYDLLFL